MEIWQLLTISLGAAGLGFTVVWSLAGKPEPLSLANLRRFGGYVSSSPARWRARREAQRERERIEKEARLQRMRTKTETKLRDDLRSAVVRLHEMQSGSASYHKIEWKAQKTRCKDAVFEIIKHMNYRFSCSGSNWENAACTNYKTDTIVFHVTKSRWCQRKLQLYILIHPSPSLTTDQYYWSEMFGGSAMVLSTPLTAGELERLGWEFPDSWESWFTKRIPGRSLPELMTPDVMEARRVRDWSPDSPFAGVKLPE